MFVVDCTDKERLSIVQEVLENMATHHNLEKRKIPFLILANKQDDDSAINEINVYYELTNFYQNHRVYYKSRDSN